jgi:hypothetical protein
VEQPAVEHGVECLSQGAQVERVALDEPDVEAAVAGLPLAVRTAEPAKSMPVTLSPRAAAIKACSPVPHLASSTRPARSPAPVSASKAGCGRPMSQGGAPDR